MAASPISEHAVIDEFVAAMRERDIPVDEPIVADGKLHRYHVEGDRGRDRNAWAILHIDAHPAGEFGCNKRHNGSKFPWSMKGTRTLTAAERAAMKEKAKLRAVQREAEDELRHAEAAQRALAIYEAAAPVPHASHPYLTRKNVPSSPKLRIGNWYYADEETGEEILVSEDALIVPMMVSTTRILSLQAIFADSREKSGFRKQFMKGGQTSGTFVSIGTPHDNVILICEGLSTGLSLWQCTGHGVLVAFASGNLDAVARQVRLRRPESRILICADNDAWGTKGKNPGVEQAQAAAVQSGTLIVIPEFLDCDTKPTDFNDLHQLEGEAIVRQFIARALEPTPAEIEAFAPLPDEDDDPPLPPDGTYDDPGGYEGPANNENFAILGYDHGIYYIFQHAQRQIHEYTVSNLNEGGFLQLADTNWWEENFPSSTGGIDKRRATNFIYRTAERKGIFTPNNIRGRGAWEDGGRLVFHHGQSLTVDGVKVDVTRILSHYVYELAAAHCMPAKLAMTDEEGFKLLELAGKFRWTMPGSAALLMGWITLAPFCGALQWRPHIWITGNAGSGKSTVVNSMVNKLLEGMSLFGQGNSTEAGFRQRLKADAIPILIDESESNEEKDILRIQSILGLMRQSSTESQAQTFKGTAGGAAMYWHIRSMFCLSSIQVGVKHQADSERISVLTLLPKLVDGRAAEQWETLREEIHSVVMRDPDIGARLFKRTLDNLPTLLANIEVFKSAAARLFKSQRSGDQYGTLLAGCFSLFSGKLATSAEAEYVINNYSWTEHVEDQNDADEGHRALQGLLEAQVRAPGGIDLSVYEILSAAQGIYRKGVDIEQDMATALLARYGMKVMDNFLVLSNTSTELRGLMSETTFKADWRGILLRLPGADRNENRPMRMNGVPVKVTRVDLSSIFEGDHRRERDLETTPY
jgi:putative DNA primase/helicase